MRSAAQFQIDKIGKTEESTSDVIFGCNKISDMINIKTNISEHNAIIATLNVTSNNNT